MELRSLYYIVVLSAVVVLLSSIVFNQGFAIQMEAGISSAKNAANVSFTGDRIITLKYPANSAFAQQLDGNKYSISFTVDSSDSNNGLSAILEKINQKLLSEKQSLVKFENATLDYRATVNGGPTSTIISYQVKLHPTITNLVTEINGASSSVLDIDWRSISLKGPLIVNTTDYGQFDINKPISGLEKLAPEVATMIQNTPIVEMFEKPVLDFQEFGTSMSNWDFSFDATIAQAEATNLGFSVNEANSKIVSTYSLGESISKEGTHTLKESSASGNIDGVTISANDLTPPPSGQMQIEGFSQIQQGRNEGTEHLIVTPQVHGNYNKDLQESLQEKSGAWKKFKDPSNGLSLQYPPDALLINSTERNILVEPNTLEKITVRINLFDDKMISSLEKNLSRVIPWSDKLDQETVHKFAEFAIDTAFNNTGALLIEDIVSGKWKLNGNNTTSFTISVMLPDSSYVRSEHVLFTNADMNKLIEIVITPPISDQMTPETKATVKKIIESIKF